MSVRRETQNASRSPDTQRISKYPDVDPGEIEPRFEEFYRRLIRLRDELLDRHQDNASLAREEQPSIMTDQGDAASEGYLRDYHLAMVSNYDEVLNEVLQALQRIADGTYGVCESTGRPIPAERLRAIPWTRFTVEAKEQLEESGNASAHTGIGPLGSMQGQDESA